MADFSTSAELDVVVNDSSLRSAKQEIEDELRGAASVNATASNQLRSDGGRSVGGRRGITGLIKSQQQTNSHFEENLRLNETRNEILRDMLDEAEARGGGGLDLGGGRMLRNLLRGRGGMLAGALGIGSAVALALSQVNWGQAVGNAIPDLSPSDLIAGAGATITASHLIANKATIALGDLISDPVDIGADALLNTLVAHPVTLTASQVLEHIVDSGSGSGATDPTTDPAPSENPSYSGASQTHSEILGDQSGSGAGFADRVREQVTNPRNIGAAAGVGAGAALLATAPVSGPAIGVGAATTAGLGYLATQSAAASDSSPEAYHGGRTTRTFPHVGSGYRSSDRTTRTFDQGDSTSSDDQLRVNVNVDERTEIDASSLRQTERQLEQKFQRLKDDIMRDVEAELSGGGY